eukprot:TRINITY_DN57347_c0_g1_i1.p1 TRINITY_DN57347_c0_g1~~TRINITY_DN57347_c0_g1_i1.p1  ORF type:complete len:327 (-),score=79.31 TRINITY_DN57347_c0_g1_i1:323-1222(-)
MALTVADVFVGAEVAAADDVAMTSPTRTPSESESPGSSEKSEGGRAARPALRLPDLRRHLPEEEAEPRLLRRDAEQRCEGAFGFGLGGGSGLFEQRTSMAHRGVGSLASSGAPRARARAVFDSCADEFLGAGATSSLRSVARHSRVRTPRPTQRQPIDESTAVPADLYERMMRLGGETRRRAMHTLAFAPPNGERYLRHHLAEPRSGSPSPLVVAASAAFSPETPAVSDDVDMAPTNAAAEAEAAAMAAAAGAALRSRPSSACALEEAAGAVAASSAAAARGGGYGWPGNGAAAVPVAA